MKKSLLFILFLGVIGTSFGQAKSTTSQGTSSHCFKEWYSLFRDRGANPVPDGVNDVVITLRNGDYSDCFMGRIEVTAGYITSKLQIQKMDGTYEEFDKKASAAYLGADNTLKQELRAINDGMSGNIQLADGEMIRLFFYKSLKDKPLGNKKAPSPNQLIKK